MCAWAWRRGSVAEQVGSKSRGLCLKDIRNKARAMEVYAFHSKDTGLNGGAMRYGSGLSGGSAN